MILFFSGCITEESSYVGISGLFVVNNYIVRSYIDVIVVTNILTRRTSKAYSIQSCIKIQKHN